MKSVRFNLQDRREYGRETVIVLDVPPRYGTYDGYGNTCVCKRSNVLSLEIVRKTFIGKDALKGCKTCAYYSIFLVYYSFVLVE